MNNNCDKCGKVPAMPEQRRACSKVYHIDCFICGWKNGDGCQKKLKLEDYTDKNGEPYCKGCYARLFGPKGYMGASATFNSYDQSTFGKSDTAATVQKPPSQPAVLDSTTSISSTGSTNHYVNDRNKPAIADEVLPGKGTVSGARSAFNPGTVKTCAKCSKSVSLAEERLACKVAWHIDCFTCGGTQTDGCRKKLTLDAYTSHADDPYCKTCYTRLFGPKGFHAGSSAITTQPSQPVEDRMSILASASSGPSPQQKNGTAPPPPPPKPSSSTSSNSSNPNHFVNDRNTPAIQTEIANFPKTGSVRAALANLKKELPNA